jgi:5'-3' exonuclease
MEGFEADDILGTLSKKAKNKGIDVTLFTGDRDSFQLIEDGITVKLPVTKGGKTETEVYDVDKIKQYLDGVASIDDGTTIREYMKENNIEEWKPQE